MSRRAGLAVRAVGGRWVRAVGRGIGGGGRDEELARVNCRARAGGEVVPGPVVAAEEVRVREDVEAEFAGEGREGGVRHFFWEGRGERWRAY
jgi:hypothetical protein